MVVCQEVTVSVCHCCKAHVLIFTFYFIYQCVLKGGGDVMSGSVFPSNQGANQQEGGAHQHNIEFQKNREARASSPQAR